MPLVLTRKLDESVMIGDDVEVTIHEISGGQVKLLIAAPRSVKLWRSELWRERRRRAADDARASSGQGAA
jgi:carbon storage regulator